MIQLTFDFAFVQLDNPVRPAEECAQHEITIDIGDRRITENVPLWVLRKGYSFLRGWIKVSLK